VAKGQKITKKELKQPDQFQSGASRLLEYIAENRQKVYLASGIAGVIVLLLVGWGIYQYNYEQHANAMYSRAYNSYKLSGYTEDEDKSYREAVTVYEELIDTYSRSDAARLAYYNMGNIYYALGEIDKSIDAYQSFLKQSKRFGMMTSLAYYGLGYCYEARKDFDNALVSFKNSNKTIEGLHFTSMNYANMARIYEKKGDQTKALEYYKKAMEQTPDPLLEALVKNKVASLG